MLDSASVYDVRESIPFLGHKQPFYFFSVWTRTKIISCGSNSEHCCPRQEEKLGIDFCLFTKFWYSRTSAAECASHSAQCWQQWSVRTNSLSCSRSLQFPLVIVRSLMTRPRSSIADTSPSTTSFSRTHCSGRNRINGAVHRLWKETETLLNREQICGRNDWIDKLESELNKYKIEISITIYTLKKCCLDSLGETSMNASRGGIVETMSEMEKVWNEADFCYRLLLLMNKKLLWWWPSTLIMIMDSRNIMLCKENIPSSSMLSMYSFFFSPSEDLWQTLALVPQTAAAVHQTLPLLA